MRGTLIVLGRDRRIGSSPRMRGTQAWEKGGRFIPAHAGNTKRSHARHSSGSVHPRACGEHGITRSSVSFSYRGGEHVEPSAGGSSPRMRGTRGPTGRLRHPRACPWIVDVIERFIPAHAGNTQSQGRDHRANAMALIARTGGGGLRFIPAHAGNTGHHVLIFDVVWIRFIPAHAGNTQMHSPAHKRMAKFNSVHPRACGEHDALQWVGAASDGSSPRMRGTRGRL